MVVAAPGMKGKLTFSPLDRSICKVYKREEVTRILGAWSQGLGWIQALPPPAYTPRTLSIHSSVPNAFSHISSDNPRGNPGKSGAYRSCSADGNTQSPER